MKFLFPIHTRLAAAVLLAVCIGWSCKRSELLDEKPSSNLVIPSTLQDFQALLDLSSDMNATPSIGEANADNYYLDLADYNGLSVSAVERNVYLWKPVVFEANITNPSWNLPYKQVFTANVVLEGLEKMTVTATNQTEVNTIKGYALFYRAYAFFNIAQVFAPMYDSATAATDLGIPLRLKSDISEKSVRSTVKETYDQIFSDLDAAAALLPAGVPPVYRNRPSKPAVQALLARIYLSMRAYTKAGAAANNCLQLYSTLIDYNNGISQTANLPFTRTNDETIYQSNMESGSRIFYGAIGVGNLDSNLYKSYAANDLRKVIYFRLVNNIPRFKGSYSGATFPFSGLAVDEQYLIRAECYARAGNATDAMNDLNTLLRKRLSGTYVPLTAADAADALAKVLTERRKEMPARQRLSDLRRLNKEGYNIVPKRVLDNQTYTLPVGSPLYVLPIPADVIALTGMQQNPR